MIEASQSMLDVNSQGGEGAAGGGMNPVMKRHLELEIKTLQNTPRYADKVRQLLKIKQKQKEEAMHIEDTQRLVTEIEMLKVVLYLMVRKQQ
jgi:methyl coenzyme M reductase beta subunit